MQKEMKTFCFVLLPKCAETLSTGTSFAAKVVSREEPSRFLEWRGVSTTTPSDGLKRHHYGIANPTPSFLHQSSGSPRRSRSGYDKGR